MDSPVFNSAHKARAGRSENMWAPSQHTLTRNEVRSPAERNALSTHLGALLQVEKNLRCLFRAVHKLYQVFYFRSSKSKRLAFRRICGIMVSIRADKVAPHSVTVVPNARGRQESQKGVILTFLDNSSKWEVASICARQVEEKLERLFWVVRERRVRSLLAGFGGLRTGVALGNEEVRSLGNKRVEAQEEASGKAGSRLSNKRKTTKSGKEREDLK